MASRPAAAFVILAILTAGATARAEPTPVALVQAPPPIDEMGKQVAAALQKAFNVDATAVSVLVLDAPAYNEAYRRLVGGDRRPLGFEYGGIVYVRDNVLRLSRDTLTHEVLHALSGRFTEEAQDRGFVKLMEGMTDYLTHQVFPRRQLF